MVGTSKKGGCNLMEDNILDIANYITYSIGLDYDTSEKLRNIIILKLND